MSPIIKILKLAKPLHGWMVLATALITLQAALQQAMPVALKFVVDELTLQIGDGTGDYDKLIWLFGLILLINLTLVVFNSVGQRLGDHIASRLGRFLTQVYYRQIFTLPQTYFDGEMSGKILNQLTRGINSIRDFVGTSTNFIVPALLQAVFGILVLSYFDVTIALLAFAVFPIYIAISSYSTKRWGLLQQEKNVIEDRVRARIQEVISNIRLVKTFNTKTHEWSYVSKGYKDINQIYDRQSTQYHILNFIREFGLEVAFVVILFIVFRSTFMGTLSLGEMVLIIQLLNQLRWPLYGMSYILEQIQRAQADSKEFLQVLELPASETFGEKRVASLSTSPTIKFEDVSFSYETGKKVLSNINLVLDKHETVALVGHSGAGKTTLVNLILRLYEPTTGQLLIDDKQYNKQSHDWIRAHMSLVFQDNELFSSTIRDNVAYGSKSITDKQVISALKKANAYDFVKQMPSGINTDIGERGVKLSGGQKQRIQIARAIVQDKPILILDEATSSLDSKSEKLVQEALDNLFQDRLVIIIAHRFSTIQNASRVLVLDKGKIVDSGPSHILAKKDGIYSELLRYQIEGNKKLLAQYELY